jgi:hypothetical protein
MDRTVIQAFLLMCGVAQPADAALEVRTDESRGELTVSFHARPLLVYAFATNQWKPYVRELYALNGVNVLRDAPADHLHHHGLMYAIRVNGVNFWEETGQPGCQRSVKLLSSSVSRNSSDRPEAAFSQRIHWIAHSNALSASADTADALLVETRHLRLTVDEKAREVALDWQNDFEVGHAARVVRLTGSAYNGLGLRLPVEFDHVARHVNSENLPYTAAQTWDVTPARWSSVTGTVNRQPVTVTVFGRPSNAGSTRFFTMRNPFAYLAVTQNLEQQPLEYRAAETFRVRYLLTVCSRSPSAADLDKTCAQWLAGAPHP